MGTTRKGKFHRYKKTGGGTGGGGSDCNKKLNSKALEEVSQCPYFQGKRELPPSETMVFVAEELYQNRIAVLETNSGTVIGLLPVEYNYLIACLNDGWQYRGVVDSTYEVPEPGVIVTIIASKAP